MLLPCFSRAWALASTSKADSVPIRSIFLTSFIGVSIGDGSLATASSKQEGNLMIVDSFGLNEPSPLRVPGWD